MPGQKAKINVEYFRTEGNKKRLYRNIGAEFEEIVRVSLIIIGHDSCGSQHGLPPEAFLISPSIFAPMQTAHPRIRVKTAYAKRGNTPRWGGHYPDDRQVKAVFIFVKAPPKF